MKIKKIVLIILALTIYFSSSSQGIIIIFNEGNNKNLNNIIIHLSTINSHLYEWDRIWGGTNDDDLGQGIVVDSADNLYLVGTTESFGAGSDDIVLVKYDSYGIQQWYRTWGGNINEHGYGVAVDSADNIYLAGDTYEFGAGEHDIVLIKYNDSGVQQWNHTWGGINNDHGHGVAVDSSDNVYLVGHTASFGAGGRDVIVIKYNSSGVQQWNRTWGGSNTDHGWGVAVDSSDNVYLTGNTESFGAGLEDMIIVKYNSSGIQLWNRTWGGINHDSGESVVVDSLNNVYLVGNTENFGDIVLVKYDSSGIQLWNRTWGGINNYYGWGVAVDSSDNVYITGTIDFGGGYGDMILMKYDSFGVHQWNRFWSKRDYNIGNGVAADSSDNIYVAGGMGPTLDMVLVKYMKVPEIIINSPSQDEEFKEIAPDFEISILEPNITSIWYTIDGGINNYTIFQFSGKINQTAWSATPYGDITIVFYAEDYDGKIGNSDVVVKKVEEQTTIPSYPLLLIICIIGITLISLYKKEERKLS